MFENEAEACIPILWTKIVTAAYSWILQTLSKANICAVFSDLCPSNKSFTLIS